MSDRPHSYGREGLAVEIRDALANFNDPSRPVVECVTQLRSEVEALRDKVERLERGETQKEEVPMCDECERRCDIRYGPNDYRCTCGLLVKDTQPEDDS